MAGGKVWKAEGDRMAGTVLLVMVRRGVPLPETHRALGCAEMPREYHVRHRPCLESSGPLASSTPAASLFEDIEGGQSQSLIQQEPGRLRRGGAAPGRLLMPPGLLSFTLQPAVGTTWSLRSQAPRSCPHLLRTASPTTPRLTLSLCRASRGATPTPCPRCPPGALGTGPPEWIFLGHGSASRRSLARASLGR